MIREFETLRFICKGRVNARVRTSTDQVAILLVHFVGHILKVWELAGVFRQRGAVFIPYIGGWRRTILLRASQENAPARRD